MEIKFETTDISGFKVIKKNYQAKNSVCLSPGFHECLFSGVSDDFRDKMLRGFFEITEPFGDNTLNNDTASPRGKPCRSLKIE